VAKAISPTGEWGKVWLAAHLEKKLKKEDFLEANIEELTSSILRNSDKLTLRYMGNFLLGLCKIFQRQSSYFEEHSRELHDNLMTAFSHKDDADKGRKDRKVGGAAEARAAAMDATADAVVVDEELERVLASRKHLAPLEDITMKPATEDALAFNVREGITHDTFAATSEADQAALRALTKRTNRAFLSEALPIMAPTDSLVPLVELPAEVRALAAGLGGPDPLGPLDMDLDPLADANIDMGGPPLEDGEEAPLAAGAGPDGPFAKRRRKAFLFDDPAEISREVYQGYMNDRSAITKKVEYDTAIFLKHHHPSMPSFMTTYTDICNSLVQGLSWGSQVADRRRSIMAAEASPMSSAFPGMWAEAPGPMHEVPRMMAADPSGAMVPVEAAGSWEPAPIRLDMSDAPSHMGLIVTGAADNEDQNANTEARLGYSGRTEKMHKFLAKEFQDRSEAHASSSASTDNSQISYQQMCRSQSGGDRGVIAGCFFELLVLRTNGVVNLKQEKPYADIRIEKARSFGSAQ